MSDLEEFRDHCREQSAKTHSKRERAGGQPSRTSYACLGYLGLSCTHCNSSSCGCTCHPRDDVPTDADRAFWGHLASLIDDHIHFGGTA